MLQPQFLREGVAVADFFAPPKTVVGASDERAASAVSHIYASIDDDLIFTSIAAAEMVKYADNVWHAAKVAFGNEVGRICKALQIDSHDVMDIFVADTKLNLSPYYLKPAFAFGGSCLPKEVRAVGHLAEQLDVSVPLVNSLLASNRCHVVQAIKMLQPYAGKRIGFLGLTFKPGTDDLRESPTLDVMSELLERGERISAYDPNLEFGRKLQSQINYIRRVRPRQARLMDQLQALAATDADQLVAQSDVLVVSHATEDFRAALARRSPSTGVIDLARLNRDEASNGNYHGIAW